MLPMRFPAVLEEDRLVEDLLAPNEDYFLELLAILRGRYEEETVLREVLEGDQEIRSLQERVRQLPADASYYDRVRLGEMIVNALAEQREIDAAGLLEPLEPLAVGMVTQHPPAPRMW